MQGDGYFYIELTTTDNAATVYNKETTTTLQAKKGWNYIAVHADEIYEYTYITMYHRSEQHTTAPYYSKFETVFKGYYYQGNDDITILGCKTYQMMGNTAYLPSKAGSYVYNAAPATPPTTTLWPTDIQYGLCMKGWINTIEIWSAAGNWDTLFNIDTESRSTNIETNFLLSFINDASNNFKIGLAGWTLSTVTSSTTKIFTFDSTSAAISTSVTIG